jgi:hypothetical protein
MNNDTRWLTPREVAERACCDLYEVRRAVRRGHLQAARTPDGELRFLENWIEAWLADQLLPEDDGNNAVNDIASWWRDASWRLSA